MTTESSAIDARYATRLGAIMAIVGGIAFMIFNMLHARADDIEIYQNQIQAVADSDIWIVDHLGLGIGMLVLSVGLLFLGRSIVGGRAQVGSRSPNLRCSPAWDSALCCSQLTASHRSSFTTRLLLHRPANRRQRSESLNLMEQIDVGLFSMWIIVFFGFTFGSYGAALKMSDSYHMAYGWIALVLGIVAIAIGLFQAIDGLSTEVTTYAFAGVASVLNVWVIVIGVNMWRRSSS
jgi:hypothetical protein